ncbi:MAG: endolytic transglycosylase MltG [Pseudomonadota bacterium]|jgi:UPF0755 protein|nr:endolytic transglycosylase MltG [Alphaproteobacteria bacterium]
MRYIISIFLVLCIIGGFLSYGPGGLLRQLHVPQHFSFIIQKGDSTQTIAKNLKSQKIIPHIIGFLTGAVATKVMRKPLKHGEYLIEPKITLWQIIQKIIKGNVVVHYVTIPEGLTVYEISQKLESIPILTGSVELPPEGTALPQTYDYYWGEPRQQVLQRMIKAMESLKSKVWPIYMKSSALKNWEEILTLASIVEKETGISDERSLVASVYFNRLLIGMPLQADPTVIYAITNGKTSFYRPIFKTDLSSDSPYNTYIKRGLPPTPIACPGEASIMAVLQPAQTDYLYFVANETGGHAFSTNLKAHNQNVQVLRKIEKQRNIQL